MSTESVGNLVSLEVSFKAAVWMQELLKRTNDRIEAKIGINVTEAIRADVATLYMTPDQYQGQVLLIIL